MHTKMYLGLLKHLNKLKKVYLPHVFSPTGSYNDSVYEKARAYKVLSHAEMEYYFEEIALSIAEKSYRKWCNTKKTSTPLLAMIAYYSGNYSAVPETRDGNHSDEDIDWRVNKAFTDYNAQIRSNNHGIKEKNILTIFLPIGIPVSDIDENMLIALNNFGSERGNIVHSTRAENITTPEDALNSVNNITEHINVFDEYLSLYKNAIR